MQTNNSRRRTLALATAITLLQGCGSPKSSSTSGPEGGPVPTNRIAITLTVESKASGTAVVRANLNDGRALGDSYRLDGGDFLRACIAGVCHSMADNDSVFAPDYIARFDYLPGVDYVVSLDRREARDAPDSRVRLPPDFTIVTPADHQQVTDGESMQVVWSPTGAPARAALSYQADCTFIGGSHSYSGGRLGEDSDADGRESVDIDPIVTFARSNAVSAITRCSIDVTVSHQLEGRIDPAFHRGTALGIVSRKVNLAYLPR
jgi:hypothetical protein